TDCTTTLTNLRTKFENAFNSEFKVHMQKYTRFDAQSFKDAMIWGGTKLEVQDDNSRSGNDTDADDADIRPIYDEEPMAEVQLTAECNIFAIGQQHTEQPKIINEEVNSRAKIQSHQTRNHNKPVDQKSHTQIPGRQIFTGHMFSPNKTFAVYEKTSPISDLRWKPMGRSFRFVGLRWIPTRKLFDSCTSKVDSEPTHELESIFGPLFDEYFNGENQGVSKSSDVTTADTSDKHQQQLYSTSSTSTLATTVTADGNFDL
nr:hypothetical protein [Tanacetum cinerariifolium]